MAKQKKIDVEKLAMDNDSDELEEEYPVDANDSTETFSLNSQTKNSNVDTSLANTNLEHNFSTSKHLFPLQRHRYFTRSTAQKRTSQQ